MRNYKKTVTCISSFLVLGWIMILGGCNMEEKMSEISSDQLTPSLEILKKNYSTKEKIGVIYVVHGGFDQFSPQYLWDCSVQIFSYDHNSFIYKNVIWNPKYWGMVLQMEDGKKMLRQYAFEYERIGGNDPFALFTQAQLKAMSDVLNIYGKMIGIEFVTDWAGWISGDQVEHYAWPRYLYNDQTGSGSKLTFCGQTNFPPPGTPAWPDCDPNRYNVDGPAERLLKQGVSKIVMIDLTTSGVRFSKTYDVLQMTKRVVAEWNNDNEANVEVSWVNDPTNLLERSYPTQPSGWTRSLGAPTVDPSVSLKANPNPIASDPMFASLFVQRIEESFSKPVSLRHTGIMLVNHSIRNGDEYFDPKINDTLVLNKNIKALLLNRYRQMDPDNIIGAWMGIKTENPQNGLVESSREMRGETTGYAWLYESEKELPKGEWGFLYWDAFEYFKDRKVKHIVIAFPQVTTDSSLNLIEVPNQIAKEIGYKNWVKIDQLDFVDYPEIGHPFADYWGIWADTQCGETPCCFQMGGCTDGRPYPPPRQTPMDQPMGALDPHLAFDVSEFGHCGYDPIQGPPDVFQPVQEQYTGTWDMARSPNDHPYLGNILAQHVIMHLAWFCK